MAAMYKANPEGNDYLLKTGINNRHSSGPSGRRKANPRNIMAKKLADNVRTIVQWCSDQHKNLGTGVRKQNTKGIDGL